MSPATVAAGLAVGDLAVMLFELPTGWVADRWSPRTSLIIGSLVQVAGMVACWLAPGTWKLLTSSGLFRVILPASVIGAAASAASFLAQTGSAASPESVTWLVAALALVEPVGALVGSRHFRLVRPAYLLALTLAMVGAVVVGPFLVGAAALVLAGFSGAAHPARAAAIQTFANDAIRARAVSLASACDMAVSSMARPLAGIFRSRRRIR